MGVAEKCWTTPSGSRAHAKQSFRVVGGIGSPFGRSNETSLTATSHHQTQRSEKTSAEGGVGTTNSFVFQQRVFFPQFKSFHNCSAAQQQKQTPPQHSTSGLQVESRDIRQHNSQSASFCGNEATTSRFSKVVAQHEQASGHVTQPGASHPKACEHGRLLGASSLAEEHERKELVAPQQCGHERTRGAMGQSSKHFFCVDKLQASTTPTKPPEALSNESTTVVGEPGSFNQGELHGQYYFGPTVAQHSANQRRQSVPDKVQEAGRCNESELSLPASCQRNCNADEESRAQFRSAYGGGFGLDFCTKDQRHTPMEGRGNHERSTRYRHHSVSRQDHNNNRPILPFSATCPPPCDRPPLPSSNSISSGTCFPMQRQRHFQMPTRGVRKAQHQAWGRRRAGTRRRDHGTTATVHSAHIGQNGPTLHPVRGSVEGVRRTADDCFGSGCGAPTLAWRDLIRRTTCKATEAEKTAYRLLCKDVRRKPLASLSKYITLLPPEYVEIFQASARLYSDVSIWEGLVSSLSKTTFRCELTDADIGQLLRSGLIEYGVARGPGLHCFSVTEKSKARRRWIVHPFAQNEAFNDLPTFSLLGITELISLSHNYAFGATADIKCCFHQIELPESIRPFFAFSHGNTTFQISSVPTGGNASPQLGHGITFSIVVATLRMMNVQPAFYKNCITCITGSGTMMVTVYIDNIRVLGDSAIVEAFFLRFLRLCSSMDYEIGEMPMTPSSQYSFLGAEWMHNRDSLHVRAMSRTVDKIFTPSTTSTLREVLQAFGRLIYVGTLLNYDPSRLFYIYKFLGARYGWILDGPAHVWPCTFPTWEVWADTCKLNEWTLHQPPTHHSAQNLVVFSDASDSGWGMFVGTSPPTVRGEAWDVSQRSWHINVKEAFAALKAVEWCRSFLWARPITLFTDNTVVIGALARRRSPSFALNNAIKDFKREGVTVLYVPSASNLADAPSRWHEKSR